MSTHSAVISVRENMWLRERARKQAWEEAERLQLEAQTLKEQLAEVVKEYGNMVAQALADAPTQPDRTCDLETIASYVKESRKHLSALREGLVSAEAYGRVRMILQEGAGSVLPSLEGQLGPVQDSEMKELEQEATCLREARVPDWRARIAFAYDLKLRRANAAAEARARDADQAAELRDALRGLSGPEVAETVQQLMQVETGEKPLSADLEQWARQAERRGKAAADRAYAADVVFDELNKLGYRVDEDFSSLFVSGGEVQIGFPHSNGYRVVLRVSPEQEPEEDRVGVRLARVGHPGEPPSERQKAEDIEWEEKFCKDFEALRQSWKNRQINYELCDQARAGDNALLVVETQESPAHARTRIRARTQDRDR